MSRLQNCFNTETLTFVEQAKTFAKQTKHRLIHVYKAKCGQKWFRATQTNARSITDLSRALNRILRVSFSVQSNIFA